DSILKFTADGTFVWDFGHRPPKDAKDFKENNQMTDAFVSKGRFQLDESANEIYVINQRRVLVYDMTTGAFKRGWGGHGMPLSEITNDPLPKYKWTGGPPTAPTTRCGSSIARAARRSAASAGTAPTLDSSTGSTPS